MIASRAWFLCQPVVVANKGRKKYLLKLTQRKFKKKKQVVGKEKKKSVISIQVNQYENNDLLYKERNHVFLIVLILQKHIFVIYFVQNYIH